MNERKPPEAPQPASAEKKGRKRKAELYREEIPQFGLAYSDNARALILVLRGEDGVIFYQGYRVADHPHPDYVFVHREGGELHASSEFYCNCVASQFGKECSHRKVVLYCGGIRALKRAFSVWESEYKEGTDCPKHVTASVRPGQG